jgi:two-component system sensor histidine kinase KdpD
MTIKNNQPARVEIKHLYTISQIVTQMLNWKPALDEIVKLSRAIFIFDNLVVYLSTPKNILEVVYARAAGRGRSAEAEMAWGDAIAAAVIQKKETVLEEHPSEDQPASRLDNPFLLGIPLFIGSKPLGAIVLIRFGGPAFHPTDIELANFIAQQISLLIEREHLQEEFHKLEEQHQQYRLQDDFVATITHELRNPLGFIKGYTTTLLRSDTQWDQNTQQEFLNIIDHETDRLHELIDNLLDSARLQSGEMRMLYQPVRLDTVLNDVITRARMNHPDLQLQLKLGSPLLMVRGDPRRLAQVFENVIGNSIKYAPGSEILITINQENDEMLLTFEDFGPGIPVEYLPFIFNRFFRSPETPNMHGSGLGLYICKQIILAHKGHIQADSAAGKGLTISIRLPVSA